MPDNIPKPLSFDVSNLLVALDQSRLLGAIELSDVVGPVSVSPDSFTQHVSADGQHVVLASHSRISLSSPVILLSDGVTLGVTNAALRIKAGMPVGNPSATCSCFGTIEGDWEVTVKDHFCCRFLRSTLTFTALGTARGLTFETSVGRVQLSFHLQTEGEKRKQHSFELGTKGLLQLWPVEPYLHIVKVLRGEKADCQPKAVADHLGVCCLEGLLHLAESKFTSFNKQQEAMEPAWLVELLQRQPLHFTCLLLSSLFGEERMEPMVVSAFFRKDDSQ